MHAFKVKGEARQMMNISEIEVPYRLQLSSVNSIGNFRYNHTIVDLALTADTGQIF